MVFAELDLALHHRISYKSRMKCTGVVIRVLVVSVLAGLSGGAVAATCRVDAQTGPAASVFRLHLGADCSKEEREAKAVQASHLLAAMKQGRAVDLTGAVIQGDLRLDDLPCVCEAVSASLRACASCPPCRS